MNQLRFKSSLTLDLDAREWHTKKFNVFNRNFFSFKKSSHWHTKRQSVDMHFLIQTHCKTILHSDYFLYLWFFVFQINYVPFPYLPKYNLTLTVNIISIFK